MVNDTDVNDQAHCPACGAAYPVDQVFCTEDGTQLIPRRPRREPILGTILEGRFQIVERIGEGGMGLVYRGVQLSVDRPVAIKLIRDDLSGDPAAAQRFLREAQMATTFSHPNIVNIFELGQSESGALYLAMELLRGRTLEAELRRGPFDTRRACEVAVQLCDALAAAHARGVVHRDLKPANIMLLDDPAVRDLVKVLDFGLAKLLGKEVMRLTLAGEILGTPAYIAPETVAEDVVDPRGDLYALGCILHEMLSGAPPFTGMAAHVVLSRHLTDPPPPLPETVPNEIAALVESLLAKSPDDRPSSAAEVRDYLHAFLASTAEPVDLDDQETVLVDSTPRRFPSGTTSPPVVVARPMPPLVVVARQPPAVAWPPAPRARLPWWWWAVAAAVAAAAFGAAVIVASA